MNLYLEYTAFNNPVRDQEIQRAISRNANLNFVSNLFLFCQSDNIPPTELILPRIVIVESSIRKSVQEIFDFANRSTDDHDAIHVLLNSDIELTASFEIASRISSDVFLAITRHTLDRRIEFRLSSQDVWLWRGQCRIKEADFHLGICGCDNRLAWLAARAYKTVANPAKSLVALHHHDSAIRPGTSNPKNGVVIPKPHRFVAVTSWSDSYCQ